jgi:DNA primase
MKQTYSYSKKEHAEMEDILSAAEELLGPAVRVETHRGWAIFWCPFHGDKDRAGKGGKPNFGVNLEEGYWKCLRCGESGGSLNSLRQKLGVEWKAPVSDPLPTRPPKPPSRVQMLDEAMAEARDSLWHSPAWAYLEHRCVQRYTAMVYGLGYGISNPRVHQKTLEAARQSLLIRQDGTWLWSGGVVYADPPVHPSVVNVRYLPAEQLPTGTRKFKPADRHRSWGISASTRTILVVEGLFDMLIAAQKIHQLGHEEDTVAVYTNGASPAARVLRWFTEHSQYEYVLLRDTDEAGREWAIKILAAIRQGGAEVRAMKPPGDLDPDEAILKGWWNLGI